jgi:K+-sensing histidine kinase KdpD
MHYSKFNYPTDVFIKTLYFAGKLLRENGNLNWVPGWLVGTLGIKGCAVGITAAQQCTIHFNSHDNNSQTDIITIDANILWCSRQETLGNGNAPCHVFDCPVRQEITQRCAQPIQGVTCFPMAGKKGLLAACEEWLMLNSSPVTEILKAITHVIECSLDNRQGTEKANSYFLPSDDMAQMWLEMLAGLSHDLRTPLACIKGYVTTLLRKDIIWDPASQKEFLKIVDEETTYIESLINNLLDSSTLSWRDDLGLKKEPVLLPAIINKVLGDPSHHNKNHQFAVSFPKEFPLVEADPVRIGQVFHNLIDNAVKYSMENTRIVIKGELGAGEVIVSVADQGIGIDDEDLNRLFDKFFRASKGIQEHQKGMGLGLHLARQVLLSHGGRIWAKSKLKQGTTFYLTLPRA